MEVFHTCDYSHQLSAAWRGFHGGHAFETARCDLNATKGAEWLKPFRFI